MFRFGCRLVLVFWGFGAGRQYGLGRFLPKFRFRNVESRDASGRTVGERAGFLNNDHAGEVIGWNIGPRSLSAAQRAVALMRSLTPQAVQEMMNNGLTLRGARLFRDFYLTATARAVKGTDTAPARAALMQRVIDLMPPQPVPPVVGNVVDEDCDH